MAMGGLRPVVALYSTFLTRAFDQVNLDVGLHTQPVVFVLDRAGITGDDGPSHHGVLDMVLLSKVPDMTMFAPSNYAEVSRMLTDALDLCTEGPAAIRFPKTMPRSETTWRPATACPRARSVPVATSASSGWARCSGRPARRPQRLAEEGHSVTVWDPRVIKPLDPDMLADAADHRLVVTIEDGLRDGGIGAAIADTLSKLAPVDGPAVRGARRPVGVPGARQARRDPRPASASTPTAWLTRYWPGSGSSSGRTS